MGHRDEKKTLKVHGERRQRSGVRTAQSHSATSQTHRVEFVLDLLTFCTECANHDAELLTQQLYLSLAELPNASRLVKLGEQVTREALKLGEIISRGKEVLRAGVKRMKSIMFLACHNFHREHRTSSVPRGELDSPCGYWPGHKNFEKQRTTDETDSYLIKNIIFHINNR